MIRILSEVSALVLNTFESYEVSISNLGNTTKLESFEFFPLLLMNRSNLFSTPATQGRNRLAVNRAANAA